MIAIYLSPIYLLLNLYILRWAYLWMGTCHSILPYFGISTYIRSNLCIALHKSAYRISY